MLDVRRREFLALLGGATACSPLSARAQPAMPVVGVIGSDSRSMYADRLQAFQRGLNQTGYVEGRNVAVEYRLADGQIDLLSAFAAELVRIPVTVIAALGLPAVVASKTATATIPIVFYVGVGPVEHGLVASLNRPGGNLTGVTGLSVELVPKRLELLHELVPAAKVIALLVNPTNPNTEPQLRDVQIAARRLGLDLRVLHAAVERDFDGVFTALAQLRDAALVVGADGLFASRGRELGALTAKHRIPAIFQAREFAIGGGLASYGASIADAYAPIGVYAGRILKGERPADLPVQQVTKVDLVINLKTARALGLTVPLPLVGRADEVIE